MAKAKQTSISIYEKPNISRPGVHAKTKTSRLKSSKNYKKLYRGQGR
jgi:hypothetical protein